MHNTLDHLNLSTTSGIFNQYISLSIYIYIYIYIYMYIKNSTNQCESTSPMVSIRIYQPVSIKHNQSITFNQSESPEENQLITFINPARNESTNSVKLEQSIRINQSEQPIKRNRCPAKRNKNPRLRMMPCLLLILFCVRGGVWGGSCNRMDLLQLILCNVFGCQIEIQF